ncbi:MAG TPA: hypothetical protein PKA98_09495, partial [Acidimicrobiales bacterium]|nr:hypothetical protein [Acidimicrobiales bacterium]
MAKPLGQAHRSVLGDRVRAGAEVREQPRRRGGVEQVALAPGDHRGEHGTGGVHVGHHVDVPDLLPALVGGLHAAGGRGDAGVRAEQVDRAEAVLRHLDGTDDLGLDRDVHLH